MPESQESKIIEQLKATLEQPFDAVRVGIGDDAAVIAPKTQALVVCQDTLVSGTHFPEDTNPKAIGHKALAVNLSDLAAMGAEPSWYLMSLCLPDYNPSWVASFAQGMSALAQRYRIPLVGGDTVKGPLQVTITAAGYQSDPRLRSQARLGDLIAVTGTLGDAAAGLILKQRGAPQARLQSRLDYPQPRVRFGVAAAEKAHAMIDLSDGLHRDLHRVLEASGFAARIDVHKLPCSTELKHYFPEDQIAPLQLQGGDDYELCLTFHYKELEFMQALAKKHGVELSIIGEIIPGDGINLYNNGHLYILAKGGYDHFS
ncbi:MAG: thiamine-phosphate kinase [bacterium]